MAKDWEGARAPATLPDRPWERLPDEPTKAYTWFSLYRDMDPKERSMSALATKHGRRSTEMFTTWSKRWRWVERVGAYDVWVDSIQREAQIEMLRDAGATRARLVLDGLELLHARLTGRDEIVDGDGVIVQPAVRAIDPSMLDAKDIAALGNMISKMQGLADEAAGTKPLSEQEVTVKLSFDLGGAQQVIEGKAIQVPAGTSRELPRGESDEPSVGDTA